MQKKMLTDRASMDHTNEYVHIGFHTPCWVVSSAVLNGGFVQARHLVNLRVPKRWSSPETPEATLARYCADAGWSGTAVGMMTAASMDSMRVARESVQGIDVAVLATSGLSNPRCVGDRAEYREMTTPPVAFGTINIIAMTSAVLTGPAMVEALMMVTEAKSAVLREAGVRSPVSNRFATGTGTDAIAVVSGHGPETVGYCGKHVRFGETLGLLAMDAVSASIDWHLRASSAQARTRK